MSKKCMFWDKIIRLILGSGFIFLFGFVCQSWWWLVGAWFILTAVYGCPLYRFLPCCKTKCEIK